ncbi:hypothetical protein N9937_00570 [bacterium]|nr:hypothetical protein [bacterium]
MKQHYIVLSVNPITVQAVDGEFSYPERWVRHTGWYNSAKTSAPPWGNEFLVRHVSEEHYKECLAAKDDPEQFPTWGTDAVQGDDGNWSATVTMNDRPDMGNDA